MSDQLPPISPPPPVAPIMGPGFLNTLGNMRFMGWAGFAYGILSCLSIVGAIVGVPTIIAARRFLDGINQFEIYQRDGNEDNLRAGFEDVGRCFWILKILVIVYIVFIFLYIGALFFLGGIGLLSEWANSR